jgi:hypothetical protein
MRPADPADARAIAEVHAAGWRWAHSGVMPDGLLDSLSLKRRTDLWRDWLGRSRPGRTIWVAERGGRVVGFADCGPSND